MAEVGTNIHKFHSAKAFSSWLHLCPNQKITGGKVISSHTKKGTNPLAQALKSAANGIGNLRKDTHLTRFFRRIAYKKGRKEALTATTHKLAVIIYHMLTQYQAYQPYQKNQEQQKYKDLNKINRLMKKHKIAIEELDFDAENQ